MFRSNALRRQGCPLNFKRRLDRRVDVIRRAVLEALEERRLLASIQITNPSFEDPVLADGASTTTVTGWTLNTDAWNGDPIRIVNPSGVQFPAQVPHGQNALHIGAYAYVPGLAEVSQV